MTITDASSSLSSTDILLYLILRRCYFLSDKATYDKAIKAKTNILIFSLRSADYQVQRLYRGNTGS